MTYDPIGDRVVLFGGWSYDSNVPLDNKMWLYDFNTNSWSSIDVQTDLILKRKHTMVWDTDASSAVIYGGISGSPNTSGEPPFTKDLWVIRL
jgi:hypothetical protein